MKRSCGLILLCILFFNKTTYLQRIDTTLAAYAANYQPERLHIQFDKPAYTPGDTLWFKIYIASGANAFPLSKNCYTDFYNAGGKLLAHSVFPVVQSGAAGMFRVPDSLADNAIYIKAYTAWMLNFDTAFIFKKKISLAQKAAAQTVSSSIIPLSLSFFPEGGDAVEEVPARIAFKATIAQGMPVAISGQIINNKGTVVDTLITAHDGMGSFRITYKKVESHTARWKDEQNNLRETPLSIAAGSGATLEIISSAGKKTFVVRRSESAPDSLQQFHIVATQHQQLVYMAGINLTQTATISGGIPTNKLSTGILQITLFSSNWHPLAERICFVNNNEDVIIPSIQFTQTGFEKRAKNSFDIILPDSLTGNLSIAITDKGIGADSSSNIFRNCFYPAS